MSASSSIFHSSSSSSSSSSSAAKSILTKRFLEPSTGSSSDVRASPKYQKLSGDVQASALKVYNFIPKVLPMEFQKNTEEILSGVRDAIAAHNASGSRDHLVIHTPELSLSAYGSGDLHQTAQSSRNRTVDECLKRFMEATKACDDNPEGISLTVGFPYCTKEGKRVILHALITNGEIKSIKGKEELANNIGAHRGVEYETRYFIPCKKGIAIKLLGKELVYKEQGGIFSDEPVEICGKKVAMVICEEMFTGTDRIGPLRAGLDREIDGYLKWVLDQAIPNRRGGTNLTAQMTAVIKKALKGGELTFPATLLGFETAEFELLKATFIRSFSNFQKGYREREQKVEGEIQRDIREQNRLYRELQRSDIVLVPNGSPSAAGKMDRRSELLQLIGEAVRTDMDADASSKHVFYNNNWGFQDGSVFFDGQVIHAEYAPSGVAVKDLNGYHHGLVKPEGNPTPHYRTEQGIDEIANAIDGTDYFSGKVPLKIQFGKAVAPSLYQKVYQATEYAYGNLCKHIAAIPNPKEGELIGRDSKDYCGFFISQSGGFDSAHTVIVRAKAFELRMRELFLEKPGRLEDVLGVMQGELKLDKRACDLDIFCSRFLMQRVNASDNLRGL